MYMYVVHAYIDLDLPVDLDLHVHVGPLRLFLYPPIPFPDARPGSVTCRSTGTMSLKPIQALCCLILL